MKSKELIDGLLKKGIVTLVFELLKYSLTLGFPFVLATFAIIVSYFTPLFPWPYLICVAVFVFSMTAFGLYYFDLWRERRSPQNKLNIEPWGINWIYSGKEPDGRPTGIASAQIMLNLRNNAIFPLSISIEEFDSSINGNICDQKTYRGVPFTILPGATGFFRDNQIPMRNVECKTYQGKLIYKIKYGHPGQEKYEIKGKSRLRLIYNEEAKSYRVELLNDDQTAGMKALQIQ